MTQAERDRDDTTEVEMMSETETTKLAPETPLVEESSTMGNEDARQSSSSSSLRTSIGSATARLSDLINDNLVPARYAMVAGTGLLAAYGLAHTPLFFRHRTVAELPASYFRNRKCLRGRLIRTVENYQPDQPILCYVRHLSPMERLLSKSTLEWLMKIHPAAALGSSRPDEETDQLLLVQFAGVQSPPTNVSHAEQPLQRLARERTTVTCQLLARRVDETKGHDHVNEIKPRTKRKLDIVAEPLSPNQVAVVKLFYRSKPLQLFSTDVGESMVRLGCANVSADGLYQHTTNQRIVDTTESVKDLKKDAAYLDKLGRAEYEAAKGSYGMWADSNVRESRRDIIEEVEFQTQASIWQKVWRWIRGG